MFGVRGGNGHNFVFSPVIDIEQGFYDGDPAADNPIADSLPFQNNVSHRDQFNRVIGIGNIHVSQNADHGIAVLQMIAFDRRIDGQLHHVFLPQSPTTEQGLNPPGQPQLSDNMRVWRYRQYRQRLAEFRQHPGSEARFRRDHKRQRLHRLRSMDGCRAESVRNRAGDNMTDLFFTPAGKTLLFLNPGRAFHGIQHIQREFLRCSGRRHHNAVESFLHGLLNKILALHAGSRHGFLHRPGDEQKLPGLGRFRHQAANNRQPVTIAKQSRAHYQTIRNLQRIRQVFRRVGHPRQQHDICLNGVQRPPDLNQSGQIRCGIDNHAVHAGLDRHFRRLNPFFRSRFGDLHHQIRQHSGIIGSLTNRPHLARPLGAIVAPRREDRPVQAQLEQGLHGSNIPVILQMENYFRSATFHGLAGSHGGTARHIISAAATDFNQTDIFQSAERFAD